MRRDISCAFVILTFVISISSRTIPCTTYTVDSFYYDLTPLMSLADIETADLNTHMQYFFGICRDATQCQDAAACGLSTKSPSGGKIVVGVLDSYSWSSNYTQVGEGITLQYIGDICGPQGHYYSNIIVKCDRHTNYTFVDYQSNGCGEYVTIRSRYGCPTERPSVTADDDNSLNAGAIIGIIIGSLAGGVFFILVLAGLMMIRKRVKNSETAMYDNLTIDSTENFNVGVPDQGVATFQITYMAPPDEV